MGMSDWFVEKYDNVSSTLKDWAKATTDTTSTYYQEASTYVADKTSEGVQAVDDKLTEAQWAVYNLTNEQTAVDNALANMKDGPDKDALIKKKDDARSMFSQYVAPLVNKLWNDGNAFEVAGADATNQYSNFAGENYNGMGFLPIVAVAGATAVVATAAAVIFWANKAYALEDEIMNDPNLTAQQKADLVSKTGITGALKASYPLIFLIAAGVGYYLYTQGKK